MMIISSKNEIGLSSHDNNAICHHENIETILLHRQKAYSVWISSRIVSD